MRRLVIFLLLLLLLSRCEKYALDRQMEELCKKDGGVKVFEQITLTESEFNKIEDYYRVPQGNNTSLENALGSNYRYVEVWETIKAGDPMKGEGRLKKYMEKIYRKSDGKILGTSIQYGRAGGDFIVLGHWSNAGCPVIEKSLVDSVFINGGEK